MGEDDLLLLEVEHQHITQWTLVGTYALGWGCETDAVVDRHT